MCVPKKKHYLNASPKFVFGKGGMVGEGEDITWGVSFRLLIFLRGGGGGVWWLPFARDKKVVNFTLYLS